MCLTTVLFVLFSGSAAGFIREGTDNNGLTSLSDGERLDQMEHAMSRQHDLIYQLQSQLSNQARLLQDAYGLINQQATKLTQHEHALRQQAEIMNQQQDLARLLWEKHPARSSVGQTDRAKSVRENTLNAEDSEPVKEAPTGLNHSVRSSVSHVFARSDDVEPLEVVVSQMSQKITEIDAEIQGLKSSYQQVQGNQASTFVHWGSSQCSSNSQLVYSGVLGGAHYTQPGGGVNNLCLTMHPVPSNHTIPSGVAYLYGGEYETYDAHTNKDPVCAVCRSSFSTTVMIPGTNVCAPGWHLDYSGFLMGGYYNHVAASEYICVDPKFESRVGGDDDHDGKLLYFSVTRCGSLPCEPYQNNKVVTCAVCSK